MSPDFYYLSGAKEYGSSYSWPGTATCEVSVQLLFYTLHNNHLQIKTMPILKPCTGMFPMNTCFYHNITCVKGGNYFESKQNMFEGRKLSYHFEIPDNWHLKKSRNKKCVGKEK